MSKCPPGVFCIENYTIFCLFITAIILTYMFFWYTPNKQSNTIYINKEITSPSIFPKVNSNNSYTNTDNILLNPFTTTFK